MSFDIPITNLSAFFETMGKKVSMDKFDDKLELQKIVFLAQNYGIELGYPFEWYIRGPYCKQVSVDAHRVLDKPTESKEINVDENKVKEFGAILKPYINNTEWLEIAGSLVYLRKENYAGVELENILGYLLEDLTYGYKDFDESVVRKVLVEMLKLKLIK